MRILLVEDDNDTLRYLTRGLKESGRIVDVATNGRLGLALAQEELYDVIITDRRLPELDGIEMVRQYRAGGGNTPILMLSVAGTVEEKVFGIRIGCDDYLAKPFEFSELLARVDAISRRVSANPLRNRFRYEDLEIDFLKRHVTRAGLAISLQHREFLLLACLARHVEHVVTRSMLLESAWDYAFEPRGNVIDMHMHRLRKKVDFDHTYTLIQTVPGAGYMLRKLKNQRHHNKLN